MNNMKMQDSQQRKIGVVLSYISIFMNTLVQFIYTPFLIRMLGQSEYGLYSLAYSIIGYLTILDLGFGNAIVVYTSKYRQQGKREEEKRLHGMFKIIFYILGSIALIIGILFYFNISMFFDETMSDLEIQKTRTMILILSFNLFITFVFNIYTSIITAHEKFIYQKLMSILNIILKPILMIPLLIIGYKSIAMSIVLTLINIIILISNYLYCKNKLKIKVKYCGFDKKIFKEIFKYSFFVFLTVIVDKVNWSADEFILGAVCGTIAVSVYAVASHLNSLFVYLSTAISGIMLPKITKMIAENASDDHISNEFIKVGRLQYYIIFLMASGLCLFGKEFFILWAGKEYITSYYIALILILPLCVDLIQNLGISIMQAKNMHKFRSVLYLIIAIFNIAISIPLSKLYGGIGASIGTAVSLIIGNGIIINIYYYKKGKINVVNFWKQIFKITIPFCIPISITIGMMNVIKLNGIKSIIIYGVIYTILYCITAYMLSMNAYEQNCIKIIVKKISPIKENILKKHKLKS